MSRLRCQCGFTTGDAAGFGDHFREAFTPPDDIGTDGQAHYEADPQWLRAAGMPPAAAYACPCGFATDDITEFDDHLLLVFTPPDGTGTDGQRHGPDGNVTHGWRGPTR